MRSSNPVLSRFGASRPHTSQSGSGWDARSDYVLETRHGAAGPVGLADVMTLDDVVVKTVSLVGTTAFAAAGTFALLPNSLLGVAWIGGAVLGLVLGLVISFAQITNPTLIFTYAVVEGVFLGAVSKFFESFYDGIVLQAVVATIGTFLAMAALYKARIIRATPRFMKVVIGLAAGLMIVMLANLVITLFTGSPTILRDGGVLAIGFSLVCITVAALMFVVNFKQIEDGIAMRLPRRYGWLGAFGILVELVWLYLEILRLMSYFAED